MTEYLAVFDTLEAKMVKSPVLARLQPHIPYVIDFNASAYVMNAVLLFQQNNSNPSKEATIGYWNRTLNQAEPSHWATKRKWFVVIYAIRSVCQYIEGTLFIDRTKTNFFHQMLTFYDSYKWIMLGRL